MRWPVAWVLLALWITAGAAAPAQAHFQLNSNIRIIHVAHETDGLMLYMRLPMPYLTAGTGDGDDTPPPYTVGVVEDGMLLHRLDAAAFGTNPLGLGQAAADGHRLTIDGMARQATVKAVRVWPALEQPPFATLDEARAAFTIPPWQPAAPTPYVGDMVVDVMLHYAVAGGVRVYSLAGLLDPGLPEQEWTANLILDHGTEETLLFRRDGLMTVPVTVTRSPWRAGAGFLAEGTRHILDGADHVLFVICLALGARRFGILVWQVTGFTIGHSISLCAGFFGLTPQGAWFVPAVEVGIALSIIYAAIMALRAQEGESDRRGIATTTLITGMIGLLHGLGFSFILQELLPGNSPFLWPGLLAFNLGVEVGQVLIVAIAWPLFMALGRTGPRVRGIGRLAVALPCIGIAAVWAGQRMVPLLTPWL